MLGTATHLICTQKAWCWVQLPTSPTYRRAGAGHSFPPHLYTGGLGLGQERGLGQGLGQGSATSLLHLCSGGLGLGLGTTGSVGTVECSLYLFSCRTGTSAQVWASSLVPYPSKSG